MTNYNAVFETDLGKVSYFLQKYGCEIKKKKEFLPPNAISCTEKRISWKHDFCD